MNNEVKSTVTGLTQSEQATAIHAEFDKSGVVFADRAAALAKLKLDHPITYEDGVPVTTFDGRQVPLHKAIQRFAQVHRSDGTIGVDKATLPDVPSHGITSKSEFSSTAERAQFISKFGFDEFDKLPLNTPPPTREIVYQDDYFRLSQPEKMALIDLHGPYYATSLPRRPTGQTPGSFINHDLIAKNKAIKFS
jgi:hypothetical protein